MKKVYQYDKSGNLIGIFENICVAAKFLGVSRQAISAVCLRYGGNKFCRGFLLSYAPLDATEFKNIFSKNDKYLMDKMYTEKVDGLGDFLKKNDIDEIDCNFTEEELQRLSEIKRRKSGSVTVGM